MSEKTYMAANVALFSGSADLYHRTHPQPPIVLIDLLAQLAQVKMPALVVDLGCGSGLSTRIWAERAQQVIGIEPNDDMLQVAQACSTAATIRYQQGTSAQTGLPDACADIVTISQALHWMEPESTFAEIARILRTGGVFAAIDFDWPPAINWEMELAFYAFLKQLRAASPEDGFGHDVKTWSKEDHLSRMQASGQFRYVREALFHCIELGNAERLVGLARSWHAPLLLKYGVSEADAGIPALHAAAQRILGDELQPWYFSYRVRVGIK